MEDEIIAYFHGQPIYGSKEDLEELQKLQSQDLKALHDKMLKLLQGNK